MWRRKTMKPAVLMNILIVAAMLLGGCGPPATPTTEPETAAPTVATVPTMATVPTAAPTAAEEAKVGGQLVYGRSGGPASLDPGELASNEDIATQGQIYDTLVKV